MKDNDIISLLGTLCECPLVSEEQERPAELAAFCNRAAQIMPSGDDKRSAGLAADPDALLAVLAAVHSGTETESERNTFERAAAESAVVRLESASVLAFLDEMEAAPERVPPHVVAALASATGETAQERRSSLPAWVGRGRSWRFAAAVVVLVVAGTLSWSLHQRPVRQVIGTARGSSAATIPATASNAAVPAVIQGRGAAPTAVAKACAGVAASGVTAADKVAEGHDVRSTSAGFSASGCTGEADQRWADKIAPGAAAEEREALRRAAAARAAEIARGATEAASRKGAAAISAAHMTGAVGAFRPTANFGSTDAAAPALPPAFDDGSSFREQAPAATAMPPSGIGR